MRIISMSHKIYATFLKGLDIEQKFEKVKRKHATDRVEVNHIYTHQNVPKIPNARQYIKFIFQMLPKLKRRKRHLMRINR
jgi:hypothetical protein